MTTITKIIGENLRQARKDAKMTQLEVAKKLHKYQSDISQYECGVVELDYYKIVTLCNLYNITPNDLFEDAGNYL